MGLMPPQLELPVVRWCPEASARRSGLAIGPIELPVNIVRLSSTFAHHGVLEQASNPHPMAEASEIEVSHPRARSSVSGGDARRRPLSDAGMRAVPAWEWALWASRCSASRSASPSSRSRSAPTTCPRGRASEAIDAHGLTWLYANDPGFNHPPLMGWLASLLLRVSALTGVEFRIWFKLPSLLAECGIAALLWRRWGVKGVALYAWSAVSILVGAWGCLERIEALDAQIRARVESREAPQTRGATRFAPVVRFTVVEF